MSLKEKFIKLINEYSDVYNEVNRTQNYRHHFGSFIRNDIPNEIRVKSGFDQSKYIVKGSNGAGRWTTVPWIAVFDRRITESAQRGVYIVYLLNKETKELYLTLNQGATDVSQNGSNGSDGKLAFTGVTGSSTAKSLAKLRSNALNMQGIIGTVPFATDELIQCGAPNYDAGAVCYKKYTLENIPDDSQLYDDLQKFIDIYDKYAMWFLGEQTKSRDNSTKEEFRKWFAEQPQRNNPLLKYKDSTIDAAVHLLESGMSKLGLTKYADLNCFDITNYSEFKVIRDECYSLAEESDKKQNHSDFRNGLDYYLLFLKELANSTIADKVKQLIQAYKDDFETRNKEERYKWIAVGTYKKVWNINAPNFADMLKSAFNDTANLLRSGNYYPYKMLGIFAEKEPETLRSLFKMLYDESAPFEERCSNFRDAFENYFKPQGLNHYQDLHAISVYLTCEYPEKYYIYKYSIVKEFIKQVQYKCDSIDKMTDSEKMELMFELYDIVWGVVKDDGELQEMSKSRLDDTCYQDEAFHILTHDIIYFASKYEFESKIGIFDSWEIIDEVTAIKTCDKSFFDYNSSGVPKSICWFFEAEELETSENKSLSLVYNGVTYDAKVQNDSTDRRRVRIFWNAELGKLFSGYKDNSVKVKFTKVADLVYEIEIIGGEKEMTIKEQISAIESYIASEGFNYDGNLVENFYLSLKSKPFVILAGTSGTGKTRLVSLFAKAINAKLQIVPVRPDWSDSSDLFGHIDLSGHFKPGAIIDFIKDAYETKDTPFILCLDEMNLARVEYYMSDILSVIETRKFDISHRITSEKALVDENACRQNDGKNLYGEIIFPENLYIVGTVNMDETTFPFSKKVLDRANTIEFSYVNLLAMPSFEKNTTVPKTLTNDFLVSEYITLNDCNASDKEYIESICTKLQRINAILEKANSHIGYRVRDEIVFYMLNNKKAELLDENVAFDNQIMQKILPRIQGSSESISKMLNELLKVCESEKYEASIKKINFMIKRYEEDGFTSYWL